jgi:hypothetical protein
LYVGQIIHSLKIHFQEHIRYVRNNNPQSAFAQHILHNQPEYGQMNNIMKVLKPLSTPSMLTSYKQVYIQTFHQEKLIPEQYAGKQNPLFQMAIHPPAPPHEKTSRVTASGPHAHPSCMHLTSKPAATRGMYNIFLSSP